MSDTQISTKTPKLDRIEATGCPPGEGHIVCEDGFGLSVIANKYGYCEPRDGSGPYSSVEVGFPSERPEPWGETWVEFAEDEYHPTETVYARVPISIVRNLILLHGGEKTS